MKNFTLLAVVLLILTSCVGRKQIEKQLHAGNYDQAISNALKKLKHNKDKKRKQDYVVMLQDAYYKVVSEDHNKIARLKKEDNPETYTYIFDAYLNLEARQNAIKAVLPLQINGKELTLSFNNYSNDIVSYKGKASEFKYHSAVTLINSLDKTNNREAHTLLKYIERINPNYKDVRELLKVAHHQGTDYVLVDVKNETRQIIPNRLEEDLLDFDTYGLNDFWTVYHSHENETIDYTYEMQLQLKRINVSPESLTERQLVRQKEIIDGWEYQLDEQGNVVKDSLGNDIKIDKIINVRARFFEVNQFKSTQVIGRVVYTDLQTNHTLESFPIDSEFIFENTYGRLRGDQRALNQQDLELLRNRRVLFPSDEQMVYDTGEDLKLRLKNIITSYSFRG